MSDLAAPRDDPTWEDDYIKRIEIRVGGPLSPYAILVAYDGPLERVEPINWDVIDDRLRFLANAVRVALADSAVVIEAVLR